MKSDEDIVPDFKVVDKGKMAVKGYPRNTSDNDRHEQQIRGNFTSNPLAILDFCSHICFSLIFIIII
jgi:hypothetical protein